MARQLVAARQAGEIAAKVEAMPLKGLYLAHRLYPSPALRDMGDIDLLVRRGGLREADAALRALGYVPARDAARAAGPAVSPLNSVLYWRDGSLPVHLHWGVSNGSLPHFMYRIDADEIWREARAGEMARHHLVVTLCEHALKHSFSALIYLTDVELAGRGADWALVGDVARRWGLSKAVYYALVLLRDLMGVWSPGLDRLRVRSLGLTGRAFLAAARVRRWDGLSAAGFLSMAAGPGAKARFVRESLAPGRGASDGFSSRTFWGRMGRAVAMVWRGAGI